LDDDAAWTWPSYEVQRAPELLRTIKKSVHADRRPGRFLLTGSANVLALPHVLKWLKALRDEWKSSLARGTIFPATE
jgi:hypothetical protein